jgi:hypothetical protein
MEISVVCGGFERSQVGRVFGRDRTTVTHAVNQIECLRAEVADFDRDVDMLESAVIDHWAVAVAGDADGLAARLGELV